MSIVKTLSGLIGNILYVLQFSEKYVVSGPSGNVHRCFIHTVFHSSVPLPSHCLTVYRSNIVLQADLDQIVSFFDVFYLKWRVKQTKTGSLNMTLISFRKIRHLVNKERRVFEKLTIKTYLIDQHKMNQRLFCQSINHFKQKYHKFTGLSNLNVNILKVFLILNSISLGFWINLNMWSLETCDRHSSDKRIHRLIEKIIIRLIYNGLNC